MLFVVCVYSTPRLISSRLFAMLFVVCVYSTPRLISSRLFAMLFVVCVYSTPHLISSRLFAMLFVVCVYSTPHLISSRLFAMLFVVCVYSTPHLISSHLGFVHPLQDAALHQCLPLSSVCCFPNPGGSLLLCYVILPSSVWSSSRPLPSPWLPLCASLCPPIVL